MQFFHCLNLILRAKSLMISYTDLPFCFEPHLIVIILAVCGISTWAELPTKVQYMWVHNHKLQY